MADSVTKHHGFILSKVEETVTSSGSSGAFETFNHGQLTVTINVVSISGTNPTIQFEVQMSDDGTNWDTARDTKRISSSGFDRIQDIHLPSRYYRVKWTVTGTSPSITFDISSTLKSYKAKTNRTKHNYEDLSLLTLNAVSSSFFANGNNTVSLQVTRPTDGLLVGAFIVESSNDNENFEVIAGPVDLASGVTRMRNFSTAGFKYYRLRTTTVVAVGSPKVHVFWSATEGG